MHLFRPLACLGTFALILGLAAATATAKDKYRMQGSIPAEARYWDYSSIDAARRRLYMGRLGGVLALDLESRAITEPLFAGELIHAVMPITANLVVAADGPKNELKVYDVAANALRTTVVVGAHPDAIAFDRRTNTVVTVNKGSSDLTLIDAGAWKVTGSVSLSGDPESAIADGNGTLYVNIVDKGRIDVVNLVSARTVAGAKLQGCREPTGIAYDKDSALVISVCGNGLVKFLSAGALKSVASIAVGRGADAVLLDESRHLVFIPAGDDGTLSVLSINSPTDIVLEDTLKTEVGAGSGAVDPSSGRIYLPVGRRIRASASPGGWQPPTIAKGSFHILVIGR